MKGEKGVLQESREKGTLGKKRKGYSRKGEKRSSGKGEKRVAYRKGEEVRKNRFKTQGQDFPGLNVINEKEFNFEEI